MKNVLENKVKNWINKYKYNTILTIIIFILFLITGYSNNNVNYTVYIKDNKMELVHRIYTNNEEQYMHIDDLTEVFGDNIHEDKISGKIIITTYNKLEKIKRNDENYTIRIDGDMYFNLNKIMSLIGNDILISKDNLYIINSEYVQATTKNNRVELYDKTNSNVVKLLNKNIEVKIQKDKNLTDASSKIVNVITGNNNYGYILKENLIYEYEAKKEVEQIKKNILVKAEGELASTTDQTKIDMVAINMYRLSGVNTLTKLDYSNNISGNIKVYATVNNGQKSSNYDSDITTRMLNSDTNRYEVIQAILKGTEDLAGVNIDFGNFKASDRENFTQFIKELSALMHSNNKKVIVNIPSTQYIEIAEVAKIADYIVVQPYTSRTLASKTSGPISSINYVENEIKEILAKQVDMSKVILEVPTYSILWTERRGTVINAEQYTMKAMQLYLESNNIKSNIDKISGQNYINYTKGITTYKMWLEDEYSILQKVKLINEYDMAGISIYRSGMELKQIYEKISTNLSK